jgi:hypothetical protein
VHSGRVVKRTGDGKSGRVSQRGRRVRRAMEVQNGMIERNAGLPPERRIEFRPDPNTRSALSAALLDRHMRPSSRKRVNAGQRLSMYSIALATSLLRRAWRVVLASGVQVIDQWRAEFLANGSALFCALTID